MPTSSRRHYWIAVAICASAPAVAQLSQPGVAPARGPAAPKPTPTPTPDQSPSSVPDPQGNAPIVPDAEFDKALPPLSSDINAPLEQMTPASPVPLPTPTAGKPLPPAQAAAPIAVGDTLGQVSPEDPALAQPLPPIASFDTAPLETAADVKDAKAPTIRYTIEVTGLDKLNLTGQFKSLSALQGGHGKAANATMVSARAHEDEALAVRLMKSIGYYDATALSSVETQPNTPGELKVVMTASAGRLYQLSSIKIDAPPVVPVDLISHNLPLKPGDAIDAARIEGAEANVSLVLPQQGYPFVKVGQRDILLDDQAAQATGAYTLPVDPGARSSFGVLTTTGDPVFGLDHLNIFPRFEQGDLYDQQKRDDLRDALVATGLFSSVSVEAQATDRPGPDGTQLVDLLVRQTKGPARTLAGQAGYGTGEGFKLEGSWTHRNLFPPEGALIGTLIAGTQEQGASGTFRRANAGKRDRTFTALISADHSNYDAFTAFTGTVSARWSYDSTPIWQKRITYYYGGELVASNESVYDFGVGDRVRRNFGIAALPGQIMFDTSNNLLNPTKGYRLKLNVSPETVVGGGIHPYARTMLEADIYHGFSPKLVLAGKLKAGGIFGIDRDDLSPTRRYYGGGGGSVRGYGYQRLGPLDPQGNPVGGRSMNEFAVEARYRFGNFGIVPFFDGGQAYESSFPNGSSLQYGAGIGGRFYTNFGPLRIDLATPLNRRPGDSKLALYIGIGQAF